MNKNLAPLDNEGKPVKDASTIIQALADQLSIVRKYDKVTDRTTFEVEFPPWLKRNYSDDTVKQLVSHMTPVIEQVMSESVNKKCLDVSVEGVKGMGIRHGAAGEW
tara:strand:- start:2288 stop:2605 length:318 start_codon:yes stop_codon:yes gene_type:complete